MPRAGAAPLLRIVCNRDERRTRPEAMPPHVFVVGDRRAVMPIDPESGGTWIGVNDAGLALCLLNATLHPGSQAPDGKDPKRSRGEIVPGLLGSGDMDSAVAGLAQLDPASYPPFRLLIAEIGRSVVLASNGSRLGVQLHAWGRRPLMLTSSGLGDHIVETPRRDAFHEFFDDSGEWLLAQDRFHNHTWPGRAHLGVLMSRPDARTVSRTTIEFRPGAVSMTYAALDESSLQALPSAHVVLPLTGIEVGQ